MVKLTDEQILFLASQEISWSRLFDASDMKKRDYQDAMRQLGKSFAYGVTPCRKGGHTLRTRAGHCIQCDTAKIAFQLRNDTKGDVYLAGSYSLKLIKVGVSGDATERVEVINSYGYGGATDWELLAYSTSEYAGKVEFEVHNLLQEFSHPVSYTRQGSIVDCLELFSCGFSTAIEALGRTIPNREIRLPAGASLDRLQSVYGFDDRRSEGAFRQGNIDNH